MPFIGDIVARTRENQMFRSVLTTAAHSQIVAMSIPPGEEIGEEVHGATDQIIVVVEGRAETVIDGTQSLVGPGTLVQVPAGARHNIVNRGTTDLRLYTIYAPPEHPPGTVHRTKAEAEAAEAGQRAIAGTR